ncbi:MAG: galactose mutarotase, partial [Polaromonas sp.]
EMNAELIATGHTLPVDGTSFDLRDGPTLSERVRGRTGDPANPSPADHRVAGYDDCYVVTRAPQDNLALCARVLAPESGRVMEVWSTEPALQFYTGLLPDEPLPGGPGKGGHAHFQQRGLCLEPQGYPNAPNCSGFPSAIYAPGQPRAGKTVYRFGVVPAAA